MAVLTLYLPLWCIIFVVDGAICFVPLDLQKNAVQEEICSCNPSGSASIEAIVDIKSFGHACVAKSKMSRPRSCGRRIGSSTTMGAKGAQHGARRSPSSCFRPSSSRMGDGRCDLQQNCTEPAVSYLCRVAIGRREPLIAPPQPRGQRRTSSRVEIFGYNIEPRLSMAEGRQAWRCGPVPL